MYGIILMNWGGSAEMTGASFSRSGIASANPNSHAKNISRIGFQFDRISAASAMNPSPSVWPSRQFPITSDGEERARQAGERTREQHALVAVQRDADAERARGLGVLAARTQSQPPAQPVQGVPDRARP